HLRRRGARGGGVRLRDRSPRAARHPRRSRDAVPRRRARRTRAGAGARIPRRSAGRQRDSGRRLRVQLSAFGTMVASSSPRVRAVRLVAAVSGLALSQTDPAVAQVVDVDLGASGYIEPSGSSALRVINPSVSITGRPTEAVGVHARYEADIVSGATETVKAGRLSGVDVVSSATSFQVTRHVASGGVSITREDTELAASYSYGTENDYRSHSILVSAGTTFFQKNTELVLSYARSFDTVCTSRFPDTLAPTARLPLDSSRGCFTS